MSVDYKQSVLKLALAVAASFAGPALACTPRIEALEVTPITYDPFVSSPQGGLVRMTVAVPAGDACEVAVGLTDEAGQPLRTLDFAGGQARFEPRLRSASGAASVSDPAMARLRFAEGVRSITAEWQLFPTSEGIVTAGDHHLGLWATLREPAVGTPPVRADALLRSIARAQVNLAGAASDFDAGSDTQTLDLGELSPGKRGRVFVQIRSNVAAHLRFDSRNRGFLVANAIPGAPGIPYQLRFDGRAIDLSQPTEQAVPPAASLRGEAFELEAVVGAFRGALAGRYSDTVTIDISP